MPNLDISSTYYDDYSWSSEYKHPLGYWYPAGGQQGVRRAARMFTKQRVGGTTMFFRKKKLRPNPLPVNDFSFSQVIRNTVSGTLRYNSDTYRWIEEGLLETNPILPPEPPTQEQLYAATARLRIGFYEKLKAVRLSVPQVFAERNKTAQLVGDTAIRIADSLRSLRRGDLGGAARGLGLTRDADWYQSESSKRRGRKKRKNQTTDNLLAQRFLEIQYGWKPLLQDIHGAVEELADVELKLPPPTRISKSAKLPIVGDASYKANGYYHRSDTWKGVWTQRFYADVALHGAISKAASLGFTNPAALAWELLPFSFVVDWFYDVGGYVNAWDAEIGASFSRGGKTTFMKAERVVASQYSDPKSYMGGGTATSSMVSVHRESLSGFPTLLLPPYKDRSSVEHMFNGIALLAAVFDRKA